MEEGNRAMVDLQDEVAGIGIVGCGTIGSYVARAIGDGKVPGANLVGLADLDLAKAEELAGSLPVEVPVLETEEVIRRAELVLEAAAGPAVPELIPLCQQHDADLMVMSVGGFALDETLVDQVRAGPIRVLIPSGAIAGLDALRSAMSGRVDRVTLTTRKPPLGLAGAPHVSERQIDLSILREETVIFSGPARDAIKAFPKNVNVAVAVSLMGVGLDSTTVRVVCGPTLRSNVHELEVLGEFGKMTARTDNKPSEANPKTSALAAFSAVAMIRKYLDRLIS